MKRGRQTCRILKEIRRQIAEANDIELVTSECRYQGDCRGTCPRCEAEVSWLEEQLRRRSAAGKLIRVAGISAGLLTLAGTTAMARTPVLPAIDPGDTADSIIYAIVGSCDEFVVEPTPPPTDPDSMKIWDSVERDPEFPGGKEALLKWVAGHLRIPEGCVPGRVIVQFVVMKTGSVGQVKVVRSKDPELAKEVVRVIKSLPKFRPGMMYGEPANVWYTLPVTFKPQTPAEPAGN